MFSKIKFKIKNKIEVYLLIFIITFTVILTSYYNFSQRQIKNNYNEIINNIYFKKTTNHFIEKLEPKFKKIRHQIMEGESFDSILNDYRINKQEIQDIKNKISKKINLNKLNVNQRIYLTIDTSNNKIKKFIFQISNKERILLYRTEDIDFSKKIISTKLDKEIIYEENIILQSLYKSASDKKIPANTIIEFAECVSS